MKLKRYKVSLVILVFVFMPLLGFAKEGPLCDPQDENSTNQTLNKYFPVYIDWLTVLMELNNEIKKFSEEEGADTASILDNVKKLREEKYDKKKQRLIFKAWNFT